MRLLLLLLFCCAACQPAPEETVYRVRGQVIGVLYAGQAVRIRHEAVPGYMPGMQMDLRLAEGASAEGVQAGDKVAFELVAQPLPLTIRNLKKLPPDTPLDLAGPNPLIPPAQE